MSDDHFGILEDAPKSSSPTCCAGLFNKSQLKYMAVMWVAGLLVIAAVVTIPYLTYKLLPEAQTSSKAGLLSFSEERARKHLNHLVDTIGPRPFGTQENSVATLDYLVKQVEKIRSEAGTTLLSFYVDERPGQVIEEYKEGSFARMWTHMRNLVVTLKGKGDAAVHKNALLVSAHYDTVTMSAGATDNTQSVAVLMETLEVLAHSTQGERDLIVVFVNGEESGLLGATHMLSDPVAFPTVGTFINLDGTPGDKSMLFRSTGGWMDYMYMSAPHPLGFVVAEDIFNLGIIHSDTDWSVYKQKLNGLDWATFSHRQTYHTLVDKKIASGALQYMGDNLLAVVRKIIDLRTGDPIERMDGKSEKHVFWSFLNSGFAVYGMTASLILHIIVVVVIIVTIISIIVHRSFRWKDAYQFSAMHPARVAGLGFAFTLVTFVGTMIWTGLCVIFSYYVAEFFAWSNTPMGVWAFVFPALSVFLFIQWIITLGERKYGVVLEVSRLQVLWGHSILVAILLLATIFLSVKHVGSTYLLYLSFSTVPVQLILQHVFYLLGYMSDNQSDYVPLANEERMSLLTGNTMGYGMTHNVVEEERHMKTHVPKVDSKTTHLMWFVIFVLGVVPLIFIADILPVLFDFASSTVPSGLIGVVIGVVVYLFAIQLMPVTRRGGHLGVLALVLTIVAIACFFSFTLANRNHFTERSPYVVIPESRNGTVKFNSLERFSTNLRNEFQKLEKLRPNPQWGHWDQLACTDQATNCKTASPRNIDISSSITLTAHGSGNYTLTIVAPESQYHLFTAPGPCSHFKVAHNGTTHLWPLSSGSYGSNGGAFFEIMIADPDHDPWELSFQGPPGSYVWENGYTKPHALQGFHSLLQDVSISGFMTFMGTGSFLHSRITAIELP